LFIVSREHRRLYEYLVDRFRDDNKVEVVIDRRITDRRVPSHLQPPALDRRATDRRQVVPAHDDLTLRSHRIVTIENDGDVTMRRAP
jgi:hypothetical protein